MLASTDAYITSTWDDLAGGFQWGLTPPVGSIPCYANLSTVGLGVVDRGSKIIPRSAGSLLFLPSFYFSRCSAISTFLFPFLCQSNNGLTASWLAHEITKLSFARPREFVPENRSPPLLLFQPLFRRSVCATSVDIRLLRDKWVSRRNTRSYTHVLVKRSSYWAGRTGRREDRRNYRRLSSSTRGEREILPGIQRRPGDQARIMSSRTWLVDVRRGIPRLSIAFPRAELFTK